MIITVIISIIVIIIIIIIVSIMIIFTKIIKFATITPCPTDVRIVLENVDVTIEGYGG